MSIRIRVRAKYDMLRTRTRIDLGSLEGKRTASDASRFRDIALFLKGTVNFLVEDIKKQNLEGYWKRGGCAKCTSFLYYHHRQEQ